MRTIHEEDKYLALENRLCGLGSMMVRDHHTLDQRKEIATALFAILKRRYPEINRRHVFTRFFKLDELNGEKGR